MKTDSVLTIDEYLARRLVASKHVSPPAASARHIPITADVKQGNEAHAGRCDRWGHPCPDCPSQKSETAPRALSQEKR